MSRMAKSVGRPIFIVASSAPCRPSLSHRQIFESFWRPHLSVWLAQVQLSGQRMWKFDNITDGTESKLERRNQVFGRQYE